MTLLLFLIGIPALEIFVMIKIGENIGALNNSKEESYKGGFESESKSVAYISDFKQQDGQIRVWCSDWDQKTETDKGWIDDFNVAVETVDFKNWVNNEAYE